MATFDPDEMIQRFKERASAVRKRPMPPVEGEGRRHFIEQSKLDFQDFAMLGDAEAIIDGAIARCRIEPCRGTDFGGGCGQPIHAAESGRVVSSYWSDVYGRRLIVDHGALNGAGVATIYNHASTYTVGPGAQVQRGQVIGYVGDTGWSTGCHLHFTVMANGRAVDPANWF